MIGDWLQNTSDIPTIHYAYLSQPHCVQMDKHMQINGQNLQEMIT